MNRREYFQNATFVRDGLLERSVASLIYILVFRFIYVYYLYKDWEYFGYTMPDHSSFYTVLAIIISFLPIIFYRGLKSVSSYFSILIYVFGYVPIILTLTFTSKHDSFSQVVFQFCFMLGMVSFFLVDLLSTQKIKAINVTNKIPFLAVHIVTAFFSVYLIALFSNRMALVGFDKIYELRSSNQALSNSGMIGYLILWLSYCFYPLYFSIGIFSKNRTYIILGLLGCVFLYAISGSKATLLNPLIITAFYFLLKLKSRFSFFQLIVLAITGLTAITFAFGSLLPIVGPYFFVRTLSMPGLLASQYVTFFSNHPHTYYSHINFIGKIFNNYPYGTKPLGRVIGNFFYGNDLNANANFWVTDGVAAMGVPGVIFISILIVIFLLLLKIFFKEESKIFLFMVFTSAIMTMLNVSFFTTLLSGGLIFLIFILKFVRIPKFYK